MSLSPNVTLLLHVIVSIKSGEQVIRASVQSRLNCHVAGICRSVGCPPLTVAGLDSHLHVVCVLNRTMKVCDLVQEIKTESVRWMRVHGSPNFQWQDGYSAYSVGARQLSMLFEFISHQQQHNRRRDYDEEVINEPTWQRCDCEDEMHGIFAMEDLLFDEDPIWY